MKKFGIGLVVLVLLGGVGTYGYFQFKGSDVPTRRDSTPVDTFEIPGGPELSMGEAQENAPLYFFLFTHTEDHINHELSEERYTRGAEILRRLSYEPSLIWTLEFMGADAATVAERNNETGVLDLLKDLSDEGLVEFGYHAHHDPTYMNRPQTELSETPTFEELYEALSTWITCVKDPLYGGCVEETGGGVQAIRDNFGTVEIVTGVGYTSGTLNPRSAGVLAIWEQVPELQFTFGFPDHGSTIRASGYTESVQALMSILTPTYETSSSLFWMNNLLTSNDGIPLDDLNSLNSMEGAESIESEIAKIDRTRPQSIHVGFVSKYMYTAADQQSPTKWAYSHPDSPELPDDMVNSPQTIERNYALTEASLAYLIDTFIPENPGSRFVSSDEMVDLVTSDDYWEVDSEELYQLALWLLNEWDGAPPNYAYDGEDFYSLADSFFLLMSGLKDEYPSSGIVSEYFAAWEMDHGTAKALELEMEAVLDWAQNWDFEDVIMPSELTMGGLSVTPAQALYVLAYAYILQHDGVTLETIPVPATGNLNETFGYLEDLGCTACYDVSWSLKPARFQD